MNNRYILIAYKPHSVCYSMGHVVDSYGQDYQTHDNLTEEELLQLIARYKSDNEFTERQEAEYSLTVIKGELLFNEEAVGYVPELVEKAKPIIEEKIEETKERMKRVEEARKKADTEAKEKQERQEYERLKAKYGN